jgi:hypothetical protein
MKDILDKLAELDAKEKDFLKERFIAPRIASEQVSVRINGIISHMKITPARYQGWGIFKPKDRNTARFVREATLDEKNTYLGSFPKFRVIVLGNVENVWYGTPLDLCDNRFKIKGNIPILLPEDLDIFEVVQTRVIGGRFYFESLDKLRWCKKNKTPVSEALRVSLRENKLREISGLYKSERDLFEELLKIKIENEKKALQLTDEGRLKSALDLAGATYIEHRSRNGEFEVVYNLDG